MSLPPALLQRLKQRGLVKKKIQAPKNIAENEEVIAEDYDEMEQQDGGEEEYQYPPLYDNETVVRKRDDNFWLERMKARMGEGSSAAGYKGCPNKYNIYHKCNLYCVNRWEDGHAEPSREYMRRYKRMLRKYPLPKGWTEIYDPGCGVYYFANEADSVVSWLSPTHPKSQIGKSAALLRRQLEENNGEEVDSEENSDEQDDESDSEYNDDSDEAPKSARRSVSPPVTNKLLPQDFPSLHESLKVAAPPPYKKQISRDRREHHNRHGRGRDRDGRDVVDPMDPSSYSDIPLGKWSDGLTVASDKQKKPAEDSNEKRNRRESDSNDESDNDYN